LKENVTAPSGYPIKILPISRVEKASDTTGKRRARGFCSSHRFGILKGVRHSRSRSYATTSPVIESAIYTYSLHIKILQRTIRQADEGIVQARVSRKCSGRPGRRVGGHQGLAGKGVYADLILRIYTDELVGTELKKLGRGLARELKDDQDTPLSKNVDLAASELGITGADGEKRLNGIIGDDANLRVHTTALELGEKGQFEAERGCLDCQDEHRQDGITPGPGPRTDPSVCRLAFLSESEPFPAGKEWQAMVQEEREKSGGALKECPQLTTWRRGQTDLPRLPPYGSPGGSLRSSISLVFIVLLFF